MVIPIFLLLSLSLSCANRQSPSFHTCAYVRQYTAFFAEMQGKPCYFPILITYPYNEENNPDTRDIFLYCAQHTLGSHAKIVNAANYGNLFTTGPAEFIRYNNK